MLVYKKNNLYKKKTILEFLMGIRVHTGKHPTLQAGTNLKGQKS